MGPGATGDMERRSDSPTRVERQQPVVEPSGAVGFWQATEPARAGSTTPRAPLSASALELTDSDEVAVTDLANIVTAQRDQRLSAPRREHELDFERPWTWSIHHRAEVARAQPVLGDVPGEYDGIEELDHRVILEMR
jgi:hypothetical protein